MSSARRRKALPPKRYLAALYAVVHGNAKRPHFVAFGKSFDAFEAQLRRMVGAEDGVTDALFQFTKPVFGSYFWCPRGSWICAGFGCKLLSGHGERAWPRHCSAMLRTIETPVSGRTGKRNAR